MWGQKLGKPVKSKTFEGRRIGNISYSEHFFKILLFHKEIHRHHA